MKRFLRDLPLKRKLMAFTLSVSGVGLLIACAGFVIYDQVTYRRTMARDFAILADMFDDNVAAGLAFNDVAAIEQTLQTLSAHERIIAACVYDKKGVVTGRYHRPVGGSAAAFKFPAAQPTGQHWGTDRLDTFQNITLAGEIIGVVYIGAELGELRERAWRYAIIVGLLLVGSSFVALLLTSRLQRIISRPIEDLVRTVASVAGGTNYGVRAQKQGNDELGRLIDGFNAMLGQIQVRDTALQSAHDRLEQRVAERTARLAEASGLLEAMLANSPDLIYFKDEASRFVRFSHACLTGFGLDDPEKLRGKTDFDFYAPGHAQAVFDEEQEIIRTGHPIIGKLEKIAYADGRVAWVLTTKMPWHDGAGVIIGTFGISKDVTALKETEEKLGKLQRDLEVVLNAIGEGIHWINCDGQIIFENPAGTRLLGWEPAELHGRSAHATMHHSHADGSNYPEAECPITLTLRTGESRRVDSEVFWRKDGTSVPVEYMTTPMRDEHGTIIGAAVVFKDITEHKRAETELAALHRQLIDSSRLAGMAEVATGVLHNVGNVLNSVNVSATLVSEQARHSKSANVAKLAALFAQNKADLGDFLAKDPRGRMIPDYLGTLADELAAENQMMVTELGHLRKNIEHIKDIVAMQQAYARTSGAFETLSVPDIIEDALRMNAGSLARHEVQAVRDYRARPVVTTDKHKVMQILINLVRNAKYACDESGGTDKKIIVRTTADEHGVKIAVIDNGVGIPPENLTRIFNHGFTTRKAGHGFGLHSGALAAKEIGGTLQVESEGPGKGATFVLTLPYAPTGTTS